MGRAALILIAISIALSLHGCSSIQPEHSVTPKIVTEALAHPDLKTSRQEGWWEIAFLIDRKDPNDTHWYLDLLIAHRIIAPVIVAHDADMIAWRFHRRAVNDDTGHRFRFIFYSHRDIADEIYRTVQADPLLAKLKKTGKVKQDIYTDTSVISKPMIDDTSDQTWSEPMQIVWPIYINGVSQMWLTMIDIYSRKVPRNSNDDSLLALEEFYTRINDEITASWHDEGQHAFLHHLNAIFGYEPLLIRDISEKRF